MAGTGNAGVAAGREEGGAGQGEAEDFEMRDVRRDGLIEALLIAFTPPRGLPYPRLYPRCVPTFPDGGRIWP